MLDNAFLSGENHSCKKLRPDWFGAFFLATRRTRLGLRSRTGLKTGHYTELTEKNQSPELRGFCVLRASVANSVFLSSLDGACHASRLRASGRPFGKLRVNGRYKNHKRKHRWRGKLAATKTGTGVPCPYARVGFNSHLRQEPILPLD